MPQVHDATGMFKADVSMEAWREYDHFVFMPDGKMFVITTRIEEPVTLWIKEKPGRTGSHRVLDAKGVVHYIVEDWKRLRWQAKPGSNPVDF